MATADRLAALLPTLDCDHLPADQLGPMLVRLSALRDRLDAARSRLTAEHDRRLAWRDDGAHSQKEWLRDHCRLSAAEAAGQVRTARELAVLPATAAALAEGTIGGAHAQVAARAARDLPADALAGLDALVAQAGSAMDTAELRSAVDDYARRRAPESLEERDQRAWRTRRLHVTRTGEGAAAIDGRLDLVGGETVLTALGALAAPGGPDDTRTPEQRRADALVELARRALDTGQLPDTGQTRPPVTVVVDLATLTGERSPAAEGGGEGSGRAAKLDRFGAVSAEAARRIACDAGVTRVITGPGSQPLDVGRSARVVTLAQRRALVVRDRACVGCSAPAAWTEAHHIRHWASGGRTDPAGRGPALGLPPASPRPRPARAGVGRQRAGTSHPSANRRSAMARLLHRVLRAVRHRDPGAARRRRQSGRRPRPSRRVPRQRSSPADGRPSGA